MENDTNVDTNSRNVLDFWIVTFVNHKDDGFSRIGGMYPVQQDCRKHLDALRVLMHSDERDSLHLFPEEWDVVYDHYVCGSLKPEDTLIIPVKSLIAETK